MSPHLAGRFSELVLASTSPARRALLSALQLPFTCEAPGGDEQVPPGTTPRDTVALLAERKARAVHARLPQALVLGADQLVDLDGRALGKPADMAAALTQLRALRGRSHRILTGVCLAGPGFFACEVDVATLTVAPVSDDELLRYAATGEWEGCAGGYRVEGRGQALFSAIEGDRSSVQGLPMLLVTRLLRAAGVRFFQGS